MAKKGARRSSGGGPSEAPTMSELRDELMHALAESAEQTVGAVCSRFEAALASAARTKPAPHVLPGLPGPAGLAADPLADYDMYHDCCARLVRYIEANMETSPEFGPQMERVILACHSDAAEPVLRSVVTKDIWFHRRREKGEDDGAIKREKTARPPSRSAKPSPPSSPPPPPPPMTRSAEKRTTRSADHSSVATRSAEKRSVGTRTRSVSREPAPPSKRPRRAASARVVLDTESSEEEQEEEKAEENEVVSVDGDEDDEDEDEDDEDEDEEEEEETAKLRKGRRGRPSQPHYEQGDELLSNFKDAIGELCYPDRRTPEQSKFFKERLRRSIKFVDAQLCRPPAGQFCSRDCKKLRAVMCNGDKPCKNKICRIWHDVEVHMDCCENPQCEFKNRIMLRETMHKIDHAKQDLHRSQAELQAKRKHLASTKHGGQNDREKLVETTLLENEISQLETDIEEADEKLSRLIGTRKSFWENLSEIGVKMSDDIADEFPDFDTHYSSRRPPRKSKAPQKSKRSMSPMPTPPARKSERATPRRRGTGPHDEAKAAASTRSTRRSSRSTEDAEAQVIDVDEDEETKEGERDDSPVAVDTPQNGTREGRSEGLTEATPAVGFTLRTNLPAKVVVGEKPTSKQDAKPVQNAAPVGLPYVTTNASAEAAQSESVVDEEREIQEEAEDEHQEEAQVKHAEEVVSVHREEVVTEIRTETTVVEHREEVVVERHDEVVVEHHEELEQHDEPEQHEEVLADAHDDQGEEEEENAFSAMHARWPGGL